MHQKIILFFLLLLCSIKLFSQSRREQRLQERTHESSLNLFNGMDPDFVHYSIPDSFNHAPAVIICQSLIYHYPDNSVHTFIKEFHRKIVLNERSAVTRFSTLYMDMDLQNAGKNGDRIAIKIIKPGGKESIITGKDAIRVKEDVPRIYRSAYGNLEEIYYKLAVPDLEVGDTLEYSVLTHYSRGNRSSVIGSYSTAYFFLNQEYPVVKQKIIFYLSDKLYLSYKPVFSNAVCQRKDSENRNEHVFEFTDTYRAASEDARWLFERREWPHIKFQVMFGGRRGVSAEDTRLFVPEEADTPKTSITKEDVIKKFERLTNIEEVIPDLKSANLQSLIYSKYDDLVSLNSVEEKVEMAYRRLRLRKGNSYGRWDDEYFCSVLSNILRYLHVKTDLIMVPSREFSSLDNMLLADEVLYCLKYQDHYIFPPGDFSNINESDARFEGQQGYQAIFDESGGKVMSLKEVLIPVSASEQNTESHVFHIKFEGEQFEQVNVLDTACFGGLTKAEYHTNLEVLKSMYQEEDLNLLKKKNLSEVSKMDTNWFPTDADSNGLPDPVSEKLKNELRKVYEFYFPKVDSILGFNHFQSGTAHGKPMIGSAALYTLGNLTKKVASNYTIEIGRIIGSQVDIRQKDKKRYNHIWLDFARRLENTIYIRIPEGYKIEGLENFNFNIDNSCGQFISKAILENNQVKITTLKVYKTNFLPASEWPDLVSMLDAAYNFTQRKFVLIKL